MRRYPQLAFLCLLLITNALTLSYIALNQIRLGFAYDSLIVFQHIMESDADAIYAEAGIRDFYPAGTRLPENCIESRLLEEARKGLILALRKSHESQE